MELQQAIVQTALNTCQLFQDNVALKHGLPKQGPIAVDPPGPPEPIVVRVDSPAAAPSPALAPVAAVAPAAGSLLKKILPIVAATAIGGTGLGWLGAAGVSQFFENRQAAPTTIIQGGESGLLEHLQEKGYHLPPKGSK